MTEAIENTLQQTDNGMDVIGILDEKKLEYVLEKNQVVAMKGTIVIHVKDKLYVPIQVYTSKFTKKGDENPLWTNIDTVYKEYISAKQAGVTDAKPDYVICRCQANSRDFVRKNGQLSTMNLSLQCRNIRRADASTYEPQAGGSIEGVIEAIKPEVIIENGEETPTDRLEVMLGTVGYSGNFVPFKLKVPADLAGEFEQAYSVGDMTSFTIEAKLHHIGKKAEPKKETFFGRADAKGLVTSGYDEIELEIVNGAPPYEYEMLPEEEVWNEAKNQYRVYLENLKKEKQQKQKQEKGTAQPPSKEANSMDDLF